MPLDGFTIVVSALATHRLVRLIAVEEGPFGWSQKLRGIADPDQLTWVGRGMACTWCISFWIAPVTVYATFYQVGAIIVAGLAVSALVGLAVQCSGLLMAYADRLLKARR